MASETSSRLQTSRGHGWELLLGGDLHPREGHVSRGCDLSGIDESQDAVVLDRPAVNRQRVRELTREEQA